MAVCGQTGGRNGRTPWKAGAAVSSEDAFDDLRGRGGAATARLEFVPGGFHRRDQFRATMLRQPVLKHFHERFLFLKRQSIGGIQNLCELCHKLNVADRRALGNGEFGGRVWSGFQKVEEELADIYAYDALHGWALSEIAAEKCATLTSYHANRGARRNEISNPPAQISSEGIGSFAG